MREFKIGDKLKCKDLRLLATSETYSLDDDIENSIMIGIVKDTKILTIKYISNSGYLTFEECGWNWHGGDFYKVQVKNIIGGKLL